MPGHTKSFSMDGGCRQAGDPGRKNRFPDLRKKEPTRKGAVHTAAEAQGRGFVGNIMGGGEGRGEC